MVSGRAANLSAERQPAGADFLAAARHWSSGLPNWPIDLGLSFARSHSDLCQAGGAARNSLEQLRGS